MIKTRWMAAGMALGTGLLAALAMAPAIAGTAQAAVTGGCNAVAHVESQWGSGSSGGEVVSVTVTNVAPTAATKWTVSWALGAGQTVASAWNATVSVSAGTVTAANAPYNGNLAAGASTSFGMQLAGTGPAPVASCANDATPVSSAPASSTPPGGADVTVGQADSQTTVTLQVGRTLGVSLNSAYKPLTVSGSGLTQLSTSGGYPTGQPLAALFRAVSPGTVTLTTQTDDPCFYTTPPCARPVAQWTIRVNIVGASASSTGRTVTVGTAANHTTVSLRVGDTLVVSLPYNYDPPTVKPAGVLGAGDVTGGYPTSQPLVARYPAVAAGSADVTTTTDGPCIHLPTPCPSPQWPWTVHVSVTN